MRAKMTAKLCVASVIVGGALTPPVMRATKRRAGKAVRRSAQGYINARDRVRDVAEATGKPGHFAALGATLAMHAAKDVTDRWRQVVAEVEAETQKEERLKQAAPSDPVLAMDDYLSSPG